MELNKRLHSILTSLDKATDDAAGTTAFPILMLAFETVAAALAVSQRGSDAAELVSGLARSADERISVTLGRMAE